MTKEKIKKKRGRPSNAELKRRKDELEKTRIAWLVMTLGLALVIGIFVQNLKADQIVHKFKSPSFSGVNTSSHYLTIENQEFNRKQKIKDEIKAKRKECRDTTMQQVREKNLEIFKTCVVRVINYSLQHPLIFVFNFFWFWS